jgi:hypothetical protein
MPRVDRRPQTSDSPPAGVVSRPLIVGDKETRLAMVNPAIDPKKYDLPSSSSDDAAPIRRDTPIATPGTPNVSVGQPQAPGKVQPRREALPQAIEVSNQTTAFAASTLPDAAITAPAAPVKQGPVARVAVPEAIQAKDPAFLANLSADQLDRSYLVSFNSLRTCPDPEEEHRLKTRLAILVSRPGTCPVGKVVFDFKNPESAYSIHIDIYNYGKVAFPDRCSALQMAVDCQQRR